MTYKQKIVHLLKNGQKTIAEIFERLKIPRPSIRKILGQGAIKGEFTRVAKGVYTLVNEWGHNLLWVEHGDSLAALWDMISEGKEFDMIYLDPPYFSKNLVGRNRLKKNDWYEFVTPEQFRTIVQACKELLRTPLSPVYLMLSGAESAKSDMYEYSKAMEAAGFRLIGSGKYQKKYRNGNPVLNIRGEKSAAETVDIYTLSGKTFKHEFPPVVVEWSSVKQTEYRTQKCVGVLESFVRRSTLRGQHVLDPFGGSGEMITACINSGRKLTIIDKCVNAVENFMKGKAVWPVQMNLL